MSFIAIASCLWAIVLSIIWCRQASTRIVVLSHSISTLTWSLSAISPLPGLIIYLYSQIVSHLIHFSVITDSLFIHLFNCIYHLILLSYLYTDPPFIVPLLFDYLISVVNSLVCSYLFIFILVNHPVCFPSIPFIPIFISIFVLCLPTLSLSHLLSTFLKLYSLCL